MGRTVLVVDDEEHIREVAQTSLEVIGGHEVLAVASGAEALAVAAVAHPDAVLLDVMMPDMDGPTTLSRLKSDARTADIPVVLITAKVRQSDQSEFESLDIAGVVAKPFDPVALPEDVARVLRWH